MPFWCFFKRNKKSVGCAVENSTMSAKERKDRLAMKVMQAQTTPENVYDLSDCEAVIIPDDTFTYCKLLQKESLILRKNNLASLECGGSLCDLSNLKFLDASKNKLDHIPESIGRLTNLRILNLCNNRIKSIPSSIQDLNHLQELYLSNNKLSKVPKYLCALPKLHSLTLDGNHIKVLPTELAGLQGSLKFLQLDTEHIKDPPADILCGGVESIMKYMCSFQGVEYEGPSETHDVLDSSIGKPSNMATDMSQRDEVMSGYLSKKMAAQRRQLKAEEEMQAREKEQLATIIANNMINKNDLLKEINVNEVSDEALDYEKKKLQKLKEQLNIVENLNEEQDSQIGAYLNNSNFKEMLKSDLLAQQQDIDQEVESLVAARVVEHSRLLDDLTAYEAETCAALNELVNAGTLRKTDEFLSLLQDQEQQMETLLVDIAESSSELRRKDIVNAMQSVLMEAAISENQRASVEAQQETWVNNILKENLLIDSHIENTLTAKSLNQDSWVSTLLNDEECQAAAFKLLLMDNDLKRNTIIRQIGYIEHELLRLSSLELRKKKHGVKYGSSTMLKQRQTLVELLSSLLNEKDEREDELSEYLDSVKNCRDDEKDNDEFWLIQYQRLLAMKPAGLVEAEQNLQPKVREVIELANALDLLPIFARHSITYEQMLIMSEEDFGNIGVGRATYQGIQRALHQYLERIKIGSCGPSAPCEDELEDLPSAPPVEGAMAPPLEEEATAPPIEYVEYECVICLNDQCNVVFMPCGHVCVCIDCCSTLTICPLCRAQIDKKILSTSAH